MPRPTATMRPTSAYTRLASKSFKRSLMTSEISFVLMPNLASPCLRRRQPAPELFQSRGHSGVDEAVSVLQLHAAEDARVDDDGHSYVLLEAPRQLARDSVA